MNPIYHLQIGWLAGNVGNFDRRERRILMIASVAPDLDGIIFWNRELFDKVHHTFGHNIFFGIFLAAVLMFFAPKGRKVLLFFLSYALALSEMPVDLITAPQWPLPFFWPLSTHAYYLTDMLNIAPENIATWNFALEKIVQLVLMIALLACTVIIYIKRRRTFIELLSWRLDKFLTDFAILPFKHRCEFEGCENRAHYKCEDSDSVRCIKHCVIHRNFKITSS